MSEPIKTTGFELFPWQQEAVCSWLQGDGGIPYRGTLEIFTGGGKTLIALECLAKTSEQVPGLRCAIVVPTEALVEQWTANITKFTDIHRDEVGVLGAGSSDDFNSSRILVCVVNTASKRLPELAGEADSLMLIVDECHRAGAPTFSRVLRTPARFRLGLSATPEREELDENGEPLEYDAQILGKELGGVVFRFSLREARRQNWLPEYEIHHHGILLTEAERRKYEEASRRIDDLADRLTQFGISPEEARRASSREGPAGRLAQAYVAATSKRKDLLYRASDRTRVAARLVREALARKESARILLFHERVDEAAALYERLRESAADVPVRLEHSRLPDSERRRALRDFKDGIAAVLVSVKSLIEGIDVPDADVGVSVASSSSVRQRVQSLGRVLRRTFDETQPRKEAEMHILYVTDTVDEAIYGKEDWSDLTGEGANKYWRWPSDPSCSPELQEGPPLRPKPTEEDEWDRLGRHAPHGPQPWQGEMPSREYSVDTRGNVRTAAGITIGNPQGVDEMVLSVRGRPGGRFCVTPVYRLVIIRGEGPEAGLFVAGQLTEPFALRADGEFLPPDEFDASSLEPGQEYPGPRDKTNGTFKLRQKRGGIIERPGPDRSTEYALPDDPSRPELAANARGILENWRRVSTSGLTFHVNSLWHAWYEEAGRAVFLGKADGGFPWPSPSNEGDE